MITETLPARHRKRSCLYDHEKLWTIVTTTSSVKEFVIWTGTDKSDPVIFHINSIFFRNGVYRFGFGEFQQVVPAQLSPGGFPAGVMAQQGIAVDHVESGMVHQADFIVVIGVAGIQVFAKDNGTCGSAIYDAVFFRQIFPDLFKGTALFQVAQKLIGVSAADI